MPSTCLHAMRKDWTGMQNIIWLIEISQRPGYEGCFISRDPCIGPAMRNIPITQKEREYWGNTTQRRRPFDVVNLPKMDKPTFTRMLTYKIQKSCIWNTGEDDHFFKLRFPSREEVPVIIQDLMERGAVDEQDIAWLGGWLVQALKSRIETESFLAKHSETISLETLRRYVDEEAGNMRLRQRFGRIKTCLRESSSAPERLGPL